MAAHDSTTAGAWLLAVLVGTVPACRDQGPVTRDSAVHDAGHDVNMDGGSERPSDAGRDAPSDNQPPDAGTPDASTIQDAGDPCATKFVDRQWGTGLDDEVLGLLATPDANVYSVGYRAGSLGVVNGGPAGDSEGVVKQWRRLDEGWEAGFDTNSTDIADALTLGPDGALYFVGRTRGVVEGARAAGDLDLVLGRISAQGKLSWVAQFGTKRPELPRRISFDAWGRLLTAGYTDVYVPTNYVDAWEDPFIAAFAGVQESAPPTQAYFTQRGSDEADFAYGLAAGADGRAFLVGNVVSGPNKGAYVADVSAGGAIERRHRWSAGALENIAAVRIAADGDLVLAGTTNLRLGADAYGQQDAFVAKVSADSLEPRWITQVGSSESDWVTDMAFGPESRIVVVGDTLGSFDPNTPRRGPEDIFAVQVDSNGNLMWVWQSGSEDDDQATSVVVDACGDVIVGGSTSGDFVQPSLGRRDAFMVRARSSDLQSAH